VSSLMIVSGLKPAQPQTYGRAQQTAVPSGASAGGAVYMQIGLTDGVSVRGAPMGITVKASDGAYDDVRPNTAIRASPWAVPLSPTAVTAAVPARRSLGGTVRAGMHVKMSSFDASIEPMMTNAPYSSALTDGLPDHDDAAIAVGSLQGMALRRRSQGRHVVSTSDLILPDIHSNSHRRVGSGLGRLPNKDRRQQAPTSAMLRGGGHGDQNPDLGQLDLKRLPQSMLLGAAQREDDAIVISGRASAQHRSRRSRDVTSAPLRRNLERSRSQTARVSRTHIIPEDGDVEQYEQLTSDQSMPTTLYGQALANAQHGYAQRMERPAAASHAGRVNFSQVRMTRASSFEHHSSTDDSVLARANLRSSHGKDRMPSSFMSSGSGTTAPAAQSHWAPPSSEMWGGRVSNKGGPSRSATGGAYLDQAHLHARDRADASMTINGTTVLASEFAYANATAASAIARTGSAVPLRGSRPSVSHERTASARGRRSLGMDSTGDDMSSYQSAVAQLLGRASSGSGSRSDLAPAGPSDRKAPHQQHTSFLNHHSSSTAVPDRESSSSYVPSSHRAGISSAASSSIAGRERFTVGHRLPLTPILERHSSAHAQRQRTVIVQTSSEMAADISASNGRDRTIGHSALRLSGGSSKRPQAAASTSTPYTGYAGHNASDHEEKSWNAQYYGAR